MSDITLGIIGSGQLGSLLCQAAKKLKVKTGLLPFMAPKSKKKITKKKHTKKN